MPIVACPQCGTKLDAPESVLGKEVVCGQCGNRFVAAAAGAEPPPSESGAEFGQPLTPEPLPGPGQTPAPTGPTGPAEAPPAGISPGALFPEPPGGPRGSDLPPPAAEPPGTPLPPPPAAAPPPGPPSGTVPPPVPPTAYAPQTFEPAQPPKPSGGATGALTLGIISLVCGCCCWPGGLICGIIAIVMGNRALTEIQAGLVDPLAAGRARAGKICGIIGLIISILGAIWTIINLTSGNMPYRFH